MSDLQLVACVTDSTDDLSTSNYSTSGYAPFTHYCIERINVATVEVRVAQNGQIIKKITLKGPKPEACLQTETFFGIQKIKLGDQINPNQVWESIKSMVNLDSNKIPTPTPTIRTVVVPPSVTVALIPTIPAIAYQPTNPILFSSTGTASPLPSTLANAFTDEQGVQMGLIPAGEFLMGSVSGDIDERPVHTVYLDAFYIDIYEVTNALYAQCVKAGICTKPGCRFGDSTYNGHPVVCVSWEQDQDYCEWRGARLPTEAEWEKAARGGLEGKLYPWGDLSPNCSLANFKGCVGDTIKVGSYPPNGYGLFDMSGNAIELVWDWYSESYNTDLPSRNPRGPDRGDERVERSGSWLSSTWDLRVTNRISDYPNYWDYNNGFRCAR